MYRLFQRRNRPRPGRGSVRWTIWEIALIGVSLLLIVFPLYAEVYSWINPPLAPAAPAAQRATFTPIPTDGASATPNPGATNTPTATPNPAATNTPTVTPNPAATNTPTATPNPAATNTPTVTPNPAATNTSSPTTNPGATNTPTPTPNATPAEPPLSLVKIASTDSAAIGETFSYSIQVFSTSATAQPIQVRDTIDSQLQVVGTPSASNGSCSVSGNTVNCTVSARSGAPATIVITVRVLPNATVGGQIPNSAIATDQQITAQSDTVLVTVSNQAATVTPVTPPPTTPTDTPPPGATLTPTSTPPPGSTPTATLPPGSTPSVTPPPGATATPPPGASATPRPTSVSGTAVPSDTPGPGNKPTTPPLPPLPPTPRPGQPTPRPGQLTPTPRGGRSATPTPRPVNGGRTATALPAATATATSVPLGTPTIAPVEPGLFFRMASDWGSAFPGQTVNYVIVVSNLRASGAMNDLQISSLLPANLEVLNAKSDRGGDPTVAGNQVSLKLAALQPGESVEIAIGTKIKDTTAIGTRIVSQADLTFTGLSIPAHSNIVTVLIVGVLSAQAAPPRLQATTTVSPTAALTTATTTATPTPTATATAMATPTVTPTVRPTVAPSTPLSAGGTLPVTSSGEPVLGIALLGITMMLRTIRLHREKVRI